MMTCKVQLSYRQDETDERQGYGVNLGAGQPVDLDAEIPESGGETLRSLIERGELSGEHFEEDEQPAIPAEAEGQ
jgi:hypothetical protein